MNNLITCLVVCVLSGAAFADVNEDGVVNVSDLLLIIGNWGPCE